MTAAASNSTKGMTSFEETPVALIEDGTYAGNVDDWPGWPE